MVSASIGVYEFDSMVRGHHLWTPLIDETLQVDGKERYQQTQQLCYRQLVVVITTGECIVGHISSEISSTY